MITSITNRVEYSTDQGNIIFNGYVF